MTYCLTNYAYKQHYFYVIVSLENLNIKSIRLRNISVGNGAVRGRLEGKGGVVGSKLLATIYEY
jgi:hypothetical protein